MQRFMRALVRVVAVLLVLALAVVGVRAINGLRYPTPAALAADLRDPATYPLEQPGVTVNRLQQGSLNGFHLFPDAVTRAGLVVTWGGSEGGPDFDRGVRLAQQGHEVLSLFFWGQPRQQPTLADVPLELFDAVLAWRAAHAPEGPLTVIGTSKGAELALALQARYPEIDNLVLYAPTEHVWQGLDFTTERSSWTWRGEPLPYVSFRHASGQSTVDMVAAMALNLPVPLRAQYETAAANDPDAEAARLPFALRGHLVAFAGSDDAMWDSASAATHWGDAAPGRTEAHVYPDAGHLFGSHDGWASGYALGGTRTGNEAALAASDAILDARLAAWHARG